MPNHAEKNACELLDADHIAVKHLFVDYARQAFAPADAGQDRRDIAMKICDELTVHAQIEEEIFYPALQGALPDLARLLQEAMAEHQEAKNMVAKIQSMDSADAAMDDMVAELNRAIEQHVKEERDMLFPKAQFAPRLDLVALGAQLKQRQIELESELVQTA